jgi:putative endonuclease
MYYVYVIKNDEKEKLYYGFSSDLKRRMKEHKSKGNWRLVYYEAYESEKDARIREKRIKKYGQARTHLKNRIINSL